MEDVRPRSGDNTIARWLTVTLRLRYLIVSGIVGLSALGGPHPVFAAHSLSYIVQPGDTATEIAARYGMQVTDLSTTNPRIDLNLLSIGEALTLRPSDGQLSAPDTAPSARIAFLPSFKISPDGVVQRSRAWLPEPSPIIPAPYTSQFDGTVWASGNCGPTTLAMALGALGVTANQLDLRTLANQQMGNFDPSNGTSWESLVYAARQYGVATEGLNDGKAYRKWTLDDLKRELGLDRPVMLLVRYRDLPDHSQSSFAGDHYILALGFDPTGNLVYHDSATQGDGSYRAINLTQLLKAWNDPADGEIRAAVAFHR